VSIQRFVETEHMSKFVIANNTLFASGQTADDASDDFEGQVAQILRKIDGQLELAGIDRTHLVSATVWIDDYRKWSRFNAVWDRWVPQGHKPARSCVEAKLAFPECQVEIAIIASMTP
jgi:enamine deaminase RidA (YjgF/YER057c/UK114 family)